MENPKYVGLMIKQNYRMKLMGTHTDKSINKNFQIPERKFVTFRSKKHVVFNPKMHLY